MQSQVGHYCLFAGYPCKGDTISGQNLPKCTYQFALMLVHMDSLDQGYRSIEQGDY